MGTLDEALNEIVNALIADLPEITSSIASGIVSGAGIILDAALTLFRGICEAIEIALILLQQNTENVVAKTQTRRYLQHRGLK